MTPRLIQLSLHFSKECARHNRPAAVGALISPEVLDEFIAWVESTCGACVEFEGEGTVDGIPFVVQEGLSSPVVFFTDHEVWARALQHTDQ